MWKARSCLLGRRQIASCFQARTRCHLHTLVSQRQLDRSLHVSLLLAALRSAGQGAVSLYSPRSRVTPEAYSCSHTCTSAKYMKTKCGEDAGELKSPLKLAWGKALGGGLPGIGAQAAQVRTRLNDFSREDNMSLLRLLCAYGPCCLPSCSTIRAHRKVTLLIAGFGSDVATYHLKLPV